MNLTEKILNAHLVSGTPKAGEEVSIRIDQTLTQDSTGTMAYLQFEAMGIGRVKTKKSVAYIDHNTLQTGFENADDHQYIQSVAKKHGIFCSKPGNGICHQVHLERFGIPGMTLLGSDSHTPTGGGIGMIAIGAGGLDVEAWSPRQKKYFEVGSCSNLGDAQARRLQIRVRNDKGEKYFAHTLNNTCVAPPRMLIALLENNLNADGSIRIPEALRPYMGGKSEIR